MGFIYDVLGMECPTCAGLASAPLCSPARHGRGTREGGDYRVKHRGDGQGGR